MNEDYLWDKTGEPDREVQRLEELLGTLRYQPKPLVLPTAKSVGTKPPASWLAIAAAIAVLVLAAGLWIAFRRTKSPDSLQATQPKQTVINRSIASKSPTPAPKEMPRKLVEKAKVLHAMRSNAFARGSKIRKAARPSISPEEMAAAAEAKNQLMLALRLASAKLNLAQRRTQTPAPTYIRNQHKVG